MTQALVLLAAAYAGAALDTWWLSGFFPRFLLPDVPFLAIVYAALLLPGPPGFAVALGAAFIRELVVSAPPWSFFLASLGIYFAAREAGRRLFVRIEPFAAVAVAAFMLLESLSVSGILLLSKGRFFSLMWGAEEAVRIAWNAVLAVPLLMTDLPGGRREVTE